MPPDAPMAGVVATSPDEPAGAALSAAGADAGTPPAAPAAEPRLPEALSSSGLGALEPAERAAPAARAAPAPIEPLGLRGEDNPFAPRLSAPAGPAPAGSSLLAVLASYVLPGGGPLPASTTLLLLVQLAVILAALLAGPRPGLFERIVPSGLLGARRGCALAVSRPG